MNCNKGFPRIFKFLTPKGEPRTPLRSKVESKTKRGVVLLCHKTLRWVDNVLLLCLLLSNCLLQMLFVIEMIYTKCDWIENLLSMKSYINYFNEKFQVFWKLLYKNWVRTSMLEFSISWDEKEKIWTLRMFLTKFCYICWVVDKLLEHDTWYFYLRVFSLLSRCLIELLNLENLEIWNYWISVWVEIFKIK